MLTKALWVVNCNPSDLLTHAKRIGAATVVVRTDNAWLAGSIRMLHAAGMKVYGWRWPGVRPSDDPPNYYAPDQARYIADTLVPAGLDGYIADIESDGPGAPARDWNSRSLTALADQFAKTISTAGKAENPNFLFGLTSGFDYPTAFPNIPWDVFLAYTDAVYPQVYWRGDGGASQAGGNPQTAYARSLASWKTLHLDAKPIIPIIGQIAYLSPQSIAAFGALMVANQVNEVHYYTDVPGIADAIYSALAQPNNMALASNAPAARGG